MGSAQDRNNLDGPALRFADKVECRKRRCPVSGREFTVIGNCAGAFCFNGIRRGRSLSLKLKPVGNFEASPELFTNYLVRVDAKGAVLVAVPARGGRAAPAPFMPELNMEKNRLRLVPVLHPGEMTPFVFEAEASLIGDKGMTLEVCTTYLWAHFQAAARKPRLVPAGADSQGEARARSRKAPNGMRRSSEPGAAKADPHGEADADSRDVLNHMQEPAAPVAAATCPHAEARADSRDALRDMREPAKPDTAEAGTGDEVRAELREALNQVRFLPEPGAAQADPRGEARADSRDARSAVREPAEPDMARPDLRDAVCADLRNVLNQMQFPPEPETADEQICRGDADFWRQKGPMCVLVTGKKPEKIQ